MSTQTLKRAVARRVRDYLAEHVQLNASVGTPKFNARMRQWQVPVLATTTKAVVPVGEFLLDEKANFLAVPSVEQLQQTLERVVERVPCLVYAAPEDLEAAGFEVVRLDAS